MARHTLRHLITGLALMGLFTAAIYAGDDTSPELDDRLAPSQQRVVLGKDNPGEFPEPDFLCERGSSPDSDSAAVLDGREKLMIKIGAGEMHSRRTSSVTTQIDNAEYSQSTTMSQDNVVEASFSRPDLMVARYGPLEAKGKWHRLVCIDVMHAIDDMTADIASELSTFDALAETALAGDDQAFIRSWGNAMGFYDKAKTTLRDLKRLGAKDPTAQTMTQLQVRAEQIRSQHPVQLTVDANDELGTSAEVAFEQIFHAWKLPMSSQRCPPDGVRISLEPEADCAWTRLGWQCHLAGALEVGRCDGAGLSHKSTLTLGASGFGLGPDEAHSVADLTRQVTAQSLEYSARQGMAAVIPVPMN